MIEIVTNCRKCVHEFCPDCKIVITHVRKNGKNYSYCDKIECCQCTEQIQCEPYITYSTKIHATTPFILQQVKDEITTQKPNYEATSEGEKEK